MPAFATEGARKSNLVKMELWPETAYNYESVTFNQADAADLVVGTAVAKVTATGKWAVAVEGGAGGLGDVAGLVVEEKSAAAATDTQVLVMVRGPAIVSKEAIKLDASFGTPTEVAAAISALEAKGILVNDSI